MARTPPRNPKAARRANPAAFADVTPTGITAPPEPKPPLRVAVDAVFKNDAAMREAITENLKSRSARSQAMTARVDAAFEHFHPNSLSTEERTRRHYVPLNGPLAPVQEAVIEKGVDAIRTSKIMPSLRLHDSAGLKALVTESTRRDGSLVKTIQLDSLINLITRKPDASPSPIYAKCKAEFEAQRILDGVEGKAAEKGDGESNDKDKPQPNRDAEQLVSDTVNLQMETATSPESRLLYNVAKRANQAALESNIDSFELRKGASDVTSYHDFNSLRIAFEHVWTTVFDGQLASLGRELYNEYVNLKEFAGITTPDIGINTVDDLKNLMAEIRTLSQTVHDDTPSELTGGEGNSTANRPKGGRDLFNLGKIGVDVASGGATFLLDWMINAAKQAGNKPQITWEDFPEGGALSAHGDAINVSVDANAAQPGTVEIMLLAVDPSLWKGIEFQLYDPNVGPQPTWRAKISNNPQDPDLWDRDNYNLLILTPSQIKSGLLEFDSQEVEGGVRQNIHNGRYLLGDLAKKLAADRTRVTFTWTKG